MLIEIAVYLIAELLCGRRPQKWSPIPILRGMLVIFYGHGKRNGSRARAPYIRTSRTELNNVCACAGRGEVWGPEWFQILSDL